MKNKEKMYGMALEAGFMLSTQYGQAEHKLMPASDGETLQKFAKLIIEECAQRAEAYAYMSPNFNALAEELRDIV